MELNDFQKYLMYNGYKLKIVPIEISEKIANLAINIAYLSLNYKGAKLYSISKNKLILNCHDFYNNFFKLYPVLYAGDFFYKLKCLVENDNEMIHFNERVSKLVHPFEIPVKFKKKAVVMGTLETRKYLDDSIDYLQKAAIIFRNIVLSKTPTNISASLYAHEIMHVALLRNKGIVENYYDSEVLSIFIEFLHAYLNDQTKSILEYLMINRIDNLNNNIVKLLIEDEESLRNYSYSEEKYKCSKYLVSTLKAFHLFYIFLNSNYGLQKEMLRYIQKIIDGSLNLGEMLDKYEINLENSVDEDIIIKTYKKISQ